MTQPETAVPLLFIDQSNQMPKKSQTLPSPSGPLTTAELKSRLKPGCIILWPYRGHVEEGSVLFVSRFGVDVCWLDGHSSRNDTVPFEEVLSLHDQSGPDHEIFPFNGKGFVTEAGLKWIADHPRT